MRRISKISKFEVFAEEQRSQLTTPAHFRIPKPALYPGMEDEHVVKRCEMSYRFIEGYGVHGKFRSV